MDKIMQSLHITKVYYDLRTDPELETNYISKHRLSSIDADWSVN